MVRLKPLYAKHHGEPTPLFFNRREPQRNSPALTASRNGSHGMR